MVKKTVFLDRDGTINFDSGYISNPNEIKLLEKAADALKMLMPHYKLIVVSNQSGISRKFYTHNDVKLVNERLIELLASEGAEVDAIYYCPHQKSDNCICRKPKTGMFLQATKEHMLNLELCWMIGDRSTDIEAGLAIGARTILLPEPHDAPPLKVKPEFTCKSLLEAAETILTADKIS